MLVELEPSPAANETAEQAEDAAVAAWLKEYEEWSKIRDELIERAGSRPITAHVVSLEQRKRMLARGERPVRFPWRGG